MNRESRLMRRPRVLVVEDRLETRKFIVATLNLRNLEVKTVADADTAWANFREFKPDLVLLDIMIPGSYDGVELCRRIRGEPEGGDDTKIVFISGKSRSADLHVGRRLRADAYIVKPFSPLQLLDTIEWLLH